MADMLTSAGVIFREIPFETASTTWTINHGLGHNPNVEVQVWDEDGKLKKIYPNTMEYPDNNTVAITWTSPRRGFVLIAA